MVVICKEIVWCERGLKSSCGLILVGANLENGQLFGRDLSLPLAFECDGFKIRWVVDFVLNRFMTSFCLYISVHKDRRQLRSFRKFRRLSPSWVLVLENGCIEDGINMILVASRRRKAPLIWMPAFYYSIESSREA